MAGKMSKKETQFKKKSKILNLNLSKKTLFALSFSHTSFPFCWEMLHAEAADGEPRGVVAENTISDVMSKLLLLLCVRRACS